MLTRGISRRNGVSHMLDKLTMSVSDNVLLLVIEFSHCVALTHHFRQTPKYTHEHLKLDLGGFGRI